MLRIYVFTSSTSGAAVSLMFNIYIYYLLPFKKKKSEIKDLSHLGYSEILDSSHFGYTVISLFSFFGYSDFMCGLYVFST